MQLYDLRSKLNTQSSPPTFVMRAPFPTIYRYLGLRKEAISRIMRETADGSTAEVYNTRVFLEPVVFTVEKAEYDLPPTMDEG